MPCPSGAVPAVTGHLLERKPVSMLTKLLLGLHNHARAVDRGSAVRYHRHHSAAVELGDHPPDGVRWHCWQEQPVRAPSL